MAESLVFEQNNIPVGSLADYNLTATATPLDPSEGQGQIPTFTAAVTDLTIEHKDLPEQSVTLSDWLNDGTFTNNPHTTTGRVVSVTKGRTGLVSLDVQTFFERLNTEQTTYPILDAETLGQTTLTALEHWMLMARITKPKLGGNILHYIGQYTPYGLAETSQRVWRNAGSDGSGDGYVRYALNTPYYPTVGAWVPANPLNVNLSQSLVLGMSKGYQNRITAFLDTIQQSVTYTLKASGTTWEFKEKVGSGSETTLLSATGVTTDPEAYGMLLVTANATDTTKVDLTLRVYTYSFSPSSGYVTDYKDYHAYAVTSTLRSRPVPYLLSKGFNPANPNGEPASASFFILQENALQLEYPFDQIDIYTGTSASLPKDIPGFTGNVWENLNRFCAMFNLDIDFAEKISINPRKLRYNTSSNNDSRDFRPAKPFAKAAISETLQKREGARTVGVVYRTNIGNVSNNGVMFKADSVYSLEKGETKIETVTTGNSFAYVESPVPVSGVPVPYTSTYGSYVITGNDGYIVDPQWWTDNGGFIRAEATGKSGEIKLTMQAPAVDTVRAPYRISEGVADRPALYIWGHGLVLSEPVTKTVYTGNSKASQDVGVTFDSPFTTTALIAQNVGVKLAEKYASSDNKISLTMPKDATLNEASATYNPLGEFIYWDGSYFRANNQTITPRAISISEAHDCNIIAVTNGEFAEEKTIADWNALHLDKLIRNTNTAPLPRYES